MHQWHIINHLFHYVCIQNFLFTPSNFSITIIYVFIDVSLWGLEFDKTSVYKAYVFIHLQLLPNFFLKKKGR